MKKMAGAHVVVPRKVKFGTELPNRVAVILLLNNSNENLLNKRDIKHFICSILTLLYNLNFNQAL